MYHKGRRRNPVCSGLRADRKATNRLWNRVQKASIDSHGSLIGREDELVEVQALVLRPYVWLVTLIGPAGIGKTRLALQIAANLRDRYADGVFLVTRRSCAWWARC